MFNLKTVFLVKLFALTIGNLSHATVQIELDRYTTSSTNLSLNCRILHTYESFGGENLDSEAKAQVGTFANAEAVRAVFLLENEEPFTLKVDQNLIFTELQSLNESIQSIYVSHSLYPINDDGSVDVSLTGTSSFNVQITAAKICEEFSRNGQLRSFSESDIETLIKRVISF